ncbi:MAG: methyltransferase domain-containing protein [Planctomycetota bacterium]
MLERRLEPEVMDDPVEAAAYQAMDHTQANEAFVLRLLELLGSEPTGAALDLGTGPGDIPILLCGRAPLLRITAIDLAQSMLNLAGTKIQSAGLADRIGLHLADVKRLPFADSAFDIVFSNTILHHIPEPAEMLREAGRVLRPGGVLLIRDLFRPPDRATLDRLVDHHAGNATAEQQRLFAESLHAALTPDELAVLAEQEGLGAAQIVLDTDRHMSLQMAG